ncbi:MAG: hypothetical protein V1725_04515 [archaeon]
MEQQTIVTGVDKLLNLVNTHEEISLSKASTELNVPLHILRHWCESLEEQGLVCTRLTLRDTHLLSIAYFHKKESLGRALIRAVNASVPNQDDIVRLEQEVKQDIKILNAKLEEMQQYRALKKEIDQQEQNIQNAKTTMDKQQLSLEREKALLQQEKTDVQRSREHITTRQQKLKEKQRLLEQKECLIRKNITQFEKDVKTLEKERKDFEKHRTLFFKDRDVFIRDMSTLLEAQLCHASVREQLFTRLNETKSRDFTKTAAPKGLHNA